MDDRLRGPLVVLPPGRPELVLDDRTWPEARIKWRMLRNVMLTNRVVACSPRPARLVLSPYFSPVASSLDFGGWTE